MCAVSLSVNHVCMCAVSLSVTHVCMCVCVSQVVIIAGDFTSIRWVAIVSLFRLIRMGRLFSVGQIILSDVQRVSNRAG